jgi:hypothetical protein
VAEGFPETLRVSRAPYANHPGSAIAGVPSCEGMVVPHGLDVNPILEPQGGRLDTLYFYQSNYWLELGREPGGSWMDRAATAFRYSGPDHGRVIAFGFPLFYLPDDQVLDVLATGMSWMME